MTLCQCHINPPWTPRVNEKKEERANSTQSSLHPRNHRQKGGNYCRLLQRPFPFLSILDLGNHSAYNDNDITYIVD